MPKIAYIEKNLSAGKLDTIAQANEIIAEYQDQGFDLTLRQLYYQFVARDLIANRQTEYKRLGDIVNDGRLVGLIDWDAITDRTRSLRENPHWDSPADIIEGAADGYMIDLWEDQPSRVEVWIEKDALVGVIAGVCQELDVPFFSCRGYVSQSEMWVAAMRLRRYERRQETIILHLGDHDPSGIDMSRDIADRLELFGSEVYVKRIALTRAQVDEVGPPPNPAKVTDSRAEGYIREHGTKSWELDALDPAYLARLIRLEVGEYLDRGLFEDKKDEQEAERAQLKTVADRWDDVVEEFDLRSHEEEQ